MRPGKQPPVRCELVPLWAPDQHLTAGHCRCWAGQDIEGEKGDAGDRACQDLIPEVLCLALRLALHRALLPRRQSLQHTVSTQLVRSQGTARGLPMTDPEALTSLVSSPLLPPEFQQPPGPRTQQRGQLIGQLWSAEGPIMTPPVFPPPPVSLPFSLAFPGPSGTV